MTLNNKLYPTKKPPFFGGFYFICSPSWGAIIVF